MSNRYYEAARTQARRVVMPIDLLPALRRGTDGETLHHGTDPASPAPMQGYGEQAQTKLWLPAPL